MKKILIIALIIHIFLMCIFALFVFILPPKEGYITDNNIVKVIKETDIVNNFEDQLSPSTPNISKTISTGFFIDKDIVLTVAHGVNNESSTYTITDLFGESYTGTLIQKDYENDIAYLKTDKNFSSYQTLKFANEISINEKVHTINYNGKLREGKISKLEDNIIFSNIHFEDGDSGSPLMNNKGEIIGINVATNFAEASGMSFRLTTE